MTEASRAELASWLRLSPTSIGNLAARGVFPKSRRGYDLKESVGNYVEFIRGKYESVDGKLSLTDERAQLARAQTEEARLRIDIKRSDFISRVEAEQAMRGLVRILRQHVLAIPSRYSLCVPGIHKSEVQMLEDVIRDALSSIAKTDPQDVVKPSAD